MPLIPIPTWKIENSISVARNSFLAVFTNQLDIMMRYHGFDLWHADYYHTNWKWGTEVDIDGAFTFPWSSSSFGKLQQCYHYKNV